MNSFIIFSTILAITSGHTTYHVPTRSVDYAKGAEIYQSGLEHQSQHHGFHQSQGWQQQGYATESNQGLKNEGEKQAKVLSFTHENDGHGYQYSYETDNGIKATEHGSIEGKALIIKGEYSYKGDDGQTYTVTYTADENGFHPQGAHIPTPPPTPEGILKSLEQSKHEEASGVYDDGSYKEEKEVESQEQGLPQYQSTYEHYQPQYQPQEQQELTHYQPQEQHELTYYQQQQPDFESQGYEHGYQHQKPTYQSQAVEHGYQHQKPTYQSQAVEHGYKHQQPTFQSQGLEHAYQHLDNSGGYGAATVEVPSSSSHYRGGYHYRQ